MYHNTSTLDTQVKPIERFLSQLKGYRPYSRGFSAVCPSHQDSTNSLMVWEDETDGHVGLKCWAGCTRKQICDAVNIAETDLYVRDASHIKREPRPGLELIDLVLDKCIPPVVFSSLYITDDFKFKFKSGRWVSKAIRIPYFTIEGKEYSRYRIRTALKAKEGSAWNDDSADPVIPYGLHRLEDARQARELWLVEGESDCWTLWLHGIPALGIPGAGQTGTLQAEYLDSIDRVYIIQEPDKAGRKFSEDAYNRLSEIGYEGETYVINLEKETGAKDPNDLHKRDVKAFSAVFAECKQKAVLYTGGEPGTVKASKDLPSVFISGNQLRERTSAALDALAIAETGEPTIFVQDTRLVRVIRDKKDAPGIAHMGLAEMRNALTNSANYFRVVETAQETKFIPVPPPKDVAEDIMSLAPDAWPFPAIEAIVETPVMRPDGSILDTPGYDPATRLYYYPKAGLDIPAIPSCPTQAEVTQAVEYINGFIADFPYVSDADRANTYALLVTSVIRHLVRHVPMATINATKQGTGKGLLTDVAALVATGRTSASISQVESDEEWDKRITALLMSGATFISIDNVEGVLRSPILSKALTMDTHTGRILGISKMATVAQRAIWIANGNNMQLGGDMPRRCYPVNMAVQVSNPWEREDFTYPDLIKSITDERGKIIAALLAMVRGWYVAGKPAPIKKVARLGTFSEWVDVISGVLAYAGIGGFLENLVEMHQKADVDGKAWALFLETWYQKFGTEAFTIKQLLEKLDKDPGFADTLPDPMATWYQEQVKSLKNKIGKHLSKKNGTPFGRDNLRIVQGEDTHFKVATFKVAGYAGYAGYKSSLCLNENESDVDDKNDIDSEAKQTTHTPHTPQADPNIPLPSLNSKIDIPDYPGMNGHHDRLVSLASALQKVPGLLWKVRDTEYTDLFRPIEVTECINRLAEMLTSGDPGRVENAEAEITERLKYA